MDGVEVVWFDHYFYYDDIEQPDIIPETILESYKFNHSCIITQKKWLNGMLTFQYSSFWFGWHGMIDFNHLKSIHLKFLNQVLHEDHYFAKLLFAQANKIYVLKTKLYYYRQRANSIMTSRDNPSFENTPVYIRKIYKNLNHDAKLVKEFYRSSSLLITACMVYQFTQTHQDLPNIKLFEQIFMQKLKSWRNEILSFPEQYLEFMFENTLQRINSLEQNSCLHLLKFISVFFSDLTIIKNNLTKDQIYLNKTLEIKNQELSNQANQIQNLNQAIKNKDEFINNLLFFQTKYGTAKSRIQNHLSYKLGQAMIVNSKSVLGFISLPFIILSIVISHKQEQKAYKFKVKKNPNLALPPLETYPDYKEALKEKECFTYKLGEALIQASKNWYGGGYIKFAFKDVPRLKREWGDRKK
ncbi:glycosyltransferase family 2 protein [Campylobacter jejuni]